MATDTPIGTQWANAVRRMGRNKQEAPSWYDADLAWYANERDGALGLSGLPIEHMASMGKKQSGVAVRPRYHDGVSDRNVAAATKSRLIEEALTHLPLAARLLLLAVHTELSPRAQKELCIKRHEDEIFVAVGIFRGAVARGRKC
jgi:hypothetical protein